MADNTSPLSGAEISIADAQAGLLSDLPAPEDDKAQAAERAAPEEQAQDSTDEGEVEAAPEEVSGQEPDEGEETTEEAEPEDDDLPAIDPPASWKRSEKEQWDSLPRAAQEAVARRERERETATNRALQEAAERRKSADTELQQAALQRQTYQEQLDQILPALQASMVREFSDIKTPADIAELAKNDPDRYAQWDAAQKGLYYAQIERNQLAERQRAEQEKARHQYLAKAEERLIDEFPEWKDQERGRREISEMHQYLQDEYAIPRELLSGMTEPYQYKIARKAMLYDRAQTAKAKAVQKQVPKVQKPGAGTSKAEKAADDRAATLKRLDKTGDLNDALALMMKG